MARNRKADLSRKDKIKLFEELKHCFEQILLIYNNENNLYSHPRSIFASPSSHKIIYDDLNKKLADDVLIEKSDIQSLISRCKVQINLLEAPLTARRGEEDLHFKRFGKQHTPKPPENNELTLLKDAFSTLNKVKKKINPRIHERLATKIHNLLNKIENLLRVPLATFATKSKVKTDKHKSFAEKLAAHSFIRPNKITVPKQITKAMEQSAPSPQGTPS